MDSKQRAERLIEDFFLTEGQIDVEVIGERDRKELIQKIAVALEQERCRTSAEVLAACIKHFEKEAGKCADFANKEAGESRAAWNRQEAWYEDCADAIRKLQPAASDLEEYAKSLSLSEIARIKGLYGLASVNKPEERPVFHAEDE